jgi:hypothetical protein
MPLRVMTAFPNQRMSMMNMTIVDSVRKVGEFINTERWMRAVVLTATRESSAGNKRRGVYNVPIGKTSDHHVRVYCSTQLPVLRLW